MKKITLLLIIFFALSLDCAIAQSYSLNGSNETVTYRMNSAHSGEVALSLSADALYIDWGDGSDLDLPSSNGAISSKHNYITAGDYTIKITAKNLTYFTINCQDSKYNSSSISAIENQINWNNILGLDDYKRVIAAFSPYYESIEFGECYNLRKVELMRSQFLANVNITKLISLEEIYIGSNMSFIRNIDFSNNRKLKSLETDDTLFTYLDLSNNVFLEKLKIECFAMENTIDLRNNRQLRELCIRSHGLNNMNIGLRTLDLSNNSLVSFVAVHQGQLSANAINCLFRSLPNLTDRGGGKIIVCSNPGSDYCDPSIAIAKGWIVVQHY